jgi:small-conductance mechanosensitive channel
MVNQTVTVGLALPSPVVNMLTVVVIFVSAYLMYRLVIAKVIDRIAKALSVESGIASFWRYIALAIVMLMAGSFSASFIEGQSAIAYFAIGLILGMTFLMLFLGSKDVLANALSGYALMVYKPFRRGDVVVIDGKPGYVRDITTVYTEIVREDGIYYVPNSELMKRPFLMKPLDALSKLTILLKIRGNADVDVVEQLIRDSVKQCGETVATPEPEVYLREIGKESFTMEVVIKAASPRRARQIRSQILKAIKNSFQSAGIEIL